MADLNLATLCLVQADYTVGSGSASTFVIDATTDSLEIIFQAPDAITITELGYLYGIRTGTPPTYVIQLEGVNLSTGRSDGTIKGAGNAAFKTFTPPASTADDGLWKWPGALGASYTCSRGEYLAIVIKRSSGTINASNCSTFGYAFANAAGAFFPYVNTNNAGVNTKRTLSPIYGFRSATRTYGFPIQTYDATQYSSDSTPDERALCFTIPADAVGTYTIPGFDWYGRGPAVGKTINATLYDGTTVLQQVTIDTDALAGGGAGGISRHKVFFDEATLTPLYGGKQYRLALCPQATATNMAINTLVVSTANDFQAHPLGTNAFLSTRTDSGSWSDTLTQRPRIDPIIADWSRGNLVRGPMGSMVSYRR